ncbi:/ yicO / Putative permease yicO /:502877 Reverse [Candidatus Hepatoplasma crinochetorum]|uniref:/ yicO / Putative permease yicO /:502877 Reverse n=1 Tax=Candidatus Hepatoplasma crinochetorum TaxID=295596 RepID=A0A0G7ZNB6_9MOLU|nr:/ yicO / Putative permease yicO /:502877 Reverse [Candidatus Hepatoplasma crinochetorum]
MFDKINSSFDHYFNLKKNNTNIKKELIAGLIVFISMLYIIFVQASILSEGITIWNDANPEDVLNFNKGSIMIITAIVAGFATIMIGLFAKFPVGIAAGMGVNAFIAYSAISLIGPFASYLAILISGIFLMIVSLTGAQKRLLKAIPDDLKLAITVGIGAFIFYVGLYNTGIITQGEGTPTELGDLYSLVALLALLTIIFTTILWAYNIKGAILYGIIFAIVLGLFMNLILYYTSEINDDLPWINFDFDGYKASFNSIGDFSLLFIDGLTDKATWTNIDFYIVIFILFLISLLDSSGTIFMIEKELEDDPNYQKDQKKSKRTFFINSSAIAAGSLIGSTNTIVYAESATGVAYGGRTGLTSITTGFLFLLIIPFIPFFEYLVTDAVTIGALFIVGFLMFKNIAKINLKDSAILISTFTIIIFSILTYSIGDGIIFGLIFYVLMMIFTKRWKELDSILAFVTPILILFIVLESTL